MVGKTRRGTHIAQRGLPRFHEPLEPRLLLSGALDKSFSADGKLTTAFNNPANAVAVLIQPDKSIVTVGRIANGASTAFAVSRVNDAGAPDPSFGISGKTVITPSGTVTVHAAALQGDRKILIAGEIDNGNGRDLVVFRLNSNGFPDTDFGDNGSTVINVPGDGIANAIAVKANGEIIVGGVSSDDVSAHGVVVELDANGSPDGFFGNNGVATLGTDTITRINAVAVQADGHIVAGGFTDKSIGIDDFILFHLDGRGNADDSFDDDGVALFNLGAANDTVTSLAIQGDGKIVAGGFSGQNFAAVRVTQAGKADTTFSGDGKLTVDFGGADAANAVVVRGDGKIVLAGVTRARNNGNFALAQLNPNGTLDGSFDGDGKVVTDFGGEDNAAALAVALDGKLEAAGGSSGKFAIARYVDPQQTIGVLDPTWNVTGIAQISHSGGDGASGVVVQPDGKVLVSNGTQSDFAVSRFNSDGTLDRSFGSNGTASLNVDSDPSAIALQSDGKILIAGILFNDPQIQSRDFTVGRLTSSGQPDSTFGNNGVANFNFGSNFNAFASAIAVQADGGIVVAGTIASTNSSANKVAVIRINPIDGTLDSGFGLGSKSVFAFGGSFDSCNAMIVQSDQKIVVAGSAGVGVGKSDFGIARLNRNGTLDRAFSGDGTQTVDFSTNDTAQAVVQQRNGKLFVAGTTIDKSRRMAIARLNSDGSLDNGLNGRGKGTLAFGADSTIRSIALQVDDKIVLGGQTDSGGGIGFSNVALLRINPNGPLDTGFGNNGKTITDLGKDDRINFLAVQPDGGILAAGGDELFQVARYRGTNASATLAGTVFLDSNRNAKRDNGEAGLFKFNVFIDTNNDGVRDGSELSILTDDKGRYSFGPLAPGNYTVRVEAQSGLSPSTNNGNVRTVNLKPGLNDNIDFGQSPNTATKVEFLRVVPPVTNAGAAIALRGHLTDPDQDDELTLKVNWGDGTFETVHPGRAAFNLHHTYAHPTHAPFNRHYTIHATWFDQLGAGNSRDVTVRVNDTAPAVTRPKPA